MFVKLVWRNLWRNKRRTLITISSIFFAVILSILMRSAQLGVYGNMIKNVAGFYSGYIQIHQAGYWEDQIIDNGFVFKDSLKNVLDKESLILDYVPRLESFALASSEKRTKGAMVVGIEPGKEKTVTNIDQKVISGEYLSSNNQDGALIAMKLAKQLGLELGDTLVLIGQGYHGANVAGKFPVIGVLKFGSPKLNSSLIYLPIETAQWLYGAENIITSVVLMIDKPSKAKKIAKLIKNGLSENYEVMSWQMMMPELEQFIEADSSGGLIMMFILYMVITFGVFGTLLMMLNERKHEFGVLLAIGMKKTKLAAVVFIETIFLGLIGVILGCIGALPVVLWFSNHPYRLEGEVEKMYEVYGIEPVMPFSTDPTIFFAQAYVVLAITILLALYPVVKLLKAKAIEDLSN